MEVIDPESSQASVIVHRVRWWRRSLRAVDVSADLLQFARARSPVLHPWNDLGGRACAA
jgi:hypothetical protein